MTSSTSMRSPLGGEQSGLVEQIKSTLTSLRNSREAAVTVGEIEVGEQSRHTRVVDAGKPSRRAATGERAGQP